MKKIIIFLLIVILLLLTFLVNKYGIQHLILIIKRLLLHFRDWIKLFTNKDIILREKY